MSSSFNNRTPESYFAGLRRKDSKNALTTCRGVTDKGRACRRALASPKNSSKYDGAVVLTDNVEDPAVYFCWQHKEQADTLSVGEEGSVVSLRGRHSLENAFRSLGLEDVDEEFEPASKEASPSPGYEAHAFIPEPSTTVAQVDGQKQEHSASYPYERHRRRRSDHRRNHSSRQHQRRRNSEARPHSGGTKASFSLFACCFGSSDAPNKRERYSEEKPEVTTPYRPVLHGHQNNSHKLPSQQLRQAQAGMSLDHVRKSTSPKTPNEIRRKEVTSHRKTDSGFAIGTSKNDSDQTSSSRRESANRLHVPPTSRNKLDIYRDTSPTPGPRRSYQHATGLKSESILRIPAQPPLKERSRSTPDVQQFQRLHGDWPPLLPRDATDGMRLTYAKLLTAMSEQPSKTDSPGFIYIFWQTDVEQTEDETSAVATIISAPKLDRGLQRQETILQRRFFQTSANAPLPSFEKRKIFLKIGRAANVHQRLNQWRKQCEYDISLLRSYPHNAKGRDKGAIVPVPNVVKVERLIHLHLEMSGQRVSKQCRCGTEHKEWFEVDATPRGVRDVDEIVRQWVRWSEDKFN